MEGANLHSMGAVPLPEHHEGRFSGYLPEQHEDQLQLGFRMIEKAFCAKVQALEHEAKNLRISCEEQKQQAAGLQRKNSALEVELVEGHQRSSQLSDENKEHAKEVQSLRRQLARLEGLKKKVLESISDDTAAEYEVEDSSNAYRHHRVEDSYGSAPPLTQSYALPGAGQRHTPTSQSFGASAGPAGGSSPYGYGMPPWSASPSVPQEPITAGAAAASAAGPGGVVDGKAFFRQARNCLSYEAFNSFLSSIKQLNNQQQTREETLEQARGIFGHEQRHLYKEFEELLNRHSIL
mmetsp:Transcript_25550/g.67522  ORF Transcript_25550/g.67522 Transcript_25550/m.67522 type:complete len:293 (-) Transcript_25550:26-904(-)